MPKWTHRDVESAMDALADVGATRVTSLAHQGKVPHGLTFWLNGVRYTMPLGSGRPGGRGWLTRWVERTLEGCRD